MKLKDLLNGAAKELFPENYTCDLCGNEIFDGGNLCADCRSKVIFNDGNVCPLCGRRTSVNQLCLECKAQAPLYKKAVSAIVYEGGGIALIHKFKRGGAYLKEFFADLIARKCDCFSDADAICYIPMTRRAERRRGYNQAELLAEALSKRLDLPVCDGALTKLKDTQEQKTLNLKQREANLKGCFRADRKAVEGKTIILVDDVMTTGATADAATAQLLKRGAKGVYFACAASVEFKRRL